MTQVIIHSNVNGGISICVPTGEISIEEVLKKDCPNDGSAFIIDDSELPQGDNFQFFDAWEVNNNIVSVNLDKAKQIRLQQFNQAALQVGQSRQLNTYAGIVNTEDDNTWLSGLNASRQSINSATSISDLLANLLPN